MSLAAWTGATLENEIKRVLEEEDASGGSAELDAEMPTVFGLAELQLQQDLGLELAAEEDLTRAMVANTNTVAKPDDCIAIRSVWYEPVGGGARSYLDMRTVEWLNVYWPNDSLTGVPLYYAERDTDTIVVAPTPALAYPVIFRQTTRLIGLTPGVAVTTTYLSRVYPSALLYAALAFSEAFLGATARVQMWDGRYMSALPPNIQEQMRQRRRDYSRPRAQPAAQPEG